MLENDVRYQDTSPANPMRKLGAIIFSLALTSASAGAIIEGGQTGEVYQAAPHAILPVPDTVQPIATAVIVK